jgi:hypothetical protein
MMVWPPASFQVIPDCFMRWVTTVLQQASVTPLPIATAKLKVL